MEFSFQIDGDTHFQAKLQSKQCEDSTKNNNVKIVQKITRDVSTIVLLVHHTAMYI